MICEIVFISFFRFFYNFVILVMDSFKKSLKSHAENLGMKRTLHFHSDKRYNDVNDGDSRESFVENEESLMKKPKM